MANSSLSLVNLDVLSLEADYKAFMRGQTAYRDYDYDGSNMAAFIRVLGYNTFKNAFYLNMTLSEGFLDTAQTRASLISHAKELNYTPRSALSAVANVQISFQGKSPTYVIPKGSTFSSVVRNQSQVFSIPNTLLLTSSNGYFNTTTPIYEGPFVADSYVINYSDDTQRILLTNPNVDTSSLTVVVYENGAVDGVPYTRATTLLDIDETDKVYFLQLAETNQYEVIFGDDVIGYRPGDGATVVLDYRITRGINGNGAKSFTPDFAIGNDVSNVSIVAVSVAADGAPAESDDSIRYYAPRHFQVQERAVTSSDYEVLLRTQFPEIAAVSVFGGEELNPPRYGKVVVAVDINNVDGIPTSKRDEYYSFLKARCGLTITPIFVEPQYTYLSIKTAVLYNVNVTTVTPENLGSLVLQSILSYASAKLNDFEATMRYSRLVEAIDATDPSMVGNQTRVRVYKKLVAPKGQAISGMTVNFKMPLFTGYSESGTTFPTTDIRTVTSQPFNSMGATVFLTDDGSGILWLAQSQGSQVQLMQKVGTVNYDTGTCLITNVQVDGYDGSTLKLYAMTASQDVQSGSDTILSVEAAEVQVSVTPVRQ
jgi:hypothetical protein